MGWSYIFFNTFFHIQNLILKNILGNVLEECILSYIT